MGNRISESNLIQNYTVLFQNINKQSVIQTKLAQYGYDDDAIAQGNALFNDLLAKYNAKHTTKAQQTSVYATFKKEFINVKTIYTLDRKKAKIIYKKQPVILKNLSVTGKIPLQMANLLDVIDWFYNSLNNNPALLQPLQQLQINPQHITTQLANINKVKQAYTAYIQEKGESQQATLNKNKAFNNMAQWVSAFYNVAKIALHDKPQLLESIAKLIPS